jgi:hypothetical protein
MIDEIIFKLYPQVAYINDGIAYDKDQNIVVIDQGLVNSEFAKTAYIAKRAAEYPPITDYLDGIVKGDQAQIDAYIEACQAVKNKYPKP